MIYDKERTEIHGLVGALDSLPVASSEQLMLTRLIVRLLARIALSLSEMSDLMDAHVTMRQK